MSTVLIFSSRQKATGLPVVTEIMSAEHLPLFDDVDVIQVGARNMQNFELLKVLGKIDKPILLKRGLANTLDELLMSAEYIMAGGNERVILCERRDPVLSRLPTRNTLDISAVPMLKKKLTFRSSSTRATQPGSVSWSSRSLWQRSQPS